MFSLPIFSESAQLEESTHDLNSAIKVSFEQKQLSQEPDLLSSQSGVGKFVTHGHFTAWDACQRWDLEKRFSGRYNASIVGGRCTHTDCRE